MLAINKPSCVFVLLSICLFAACRGSGIWDDACYQSVVSHFDQKDQSLDLNKDCKNGTVDWHYPQEYLFLSYDKGDNSKFTFCMVESWVTYHGPYTDVTDGRNADMAMPTPDHPSCIASSHGKVLVRVSALKDNQYYMTSMKYSVRAA